MYSNERRVGGQEETVAAAEPACAKTELRAVAGRGDGGRGEEEGLDEDGAKSLTAHSGVPRERSIGGPRGADHSRGMD